MCTLVWMGSLAVTDASRAADERVSELVSPNTEANAYGYGAISDSISSLQLQFAQVRADGDSLVATATGGVRGGAFGLSTLFAHKRTAGGWVTQETSPRPINPNPGAATSATRGQMASSSQDKFAFTATDSFAPGNPPFTDASDPGTSLGAYLYRSGSSAEWITRPRTADAYPEPGSFVATDIAITGGAPDLSSVYFTFPGTLLPGEEARRARLVAAPPGLESLAPRGYYRYADGQLQNVGVLPGGTTDPGGAAPAGALANTLGGSEGFAGDDVSSSVSSDGRIAYFVSPDPASLGADTPQLYVRIGNSSSRLLSRTASGDEAPTGAATDGPVRAGSAAVAPTFVFANPSGTVAYFRSRDALKPDAPDDGSLKSYRYVLADDSITYLPGVTGEFLATSLDGMSLMFSDYSAGDNTVSLLRDREIARVFSAPGLAGQRNGPVRVTRDGNTWVFDSTGGPGAAGTSAHQVYRYQADTGEVTCVSCPPEGAAPSGDARFVTPAESGVSSPGYVGGHAGSVRGVSADGRRVFFDTLDALVPSDTNGKRDVYEFRDGQRVLVSTGKSRFDSFVLDNDETGDNAFFTTREGIDPGDTDGEYDIYDARVGGGFPPTPTSGPSCAASCAAPGSSAGVRVPGSESTRSEGNVRSRRGATLSATVDGSVRAGRFRVAVRAPEAGIVAVRGSAFRDVRLRVRRAGRILVSLRLTAAVQRDFERGKRTRVQVGIAFAGSVDKASISRRATLRRVGR